MKPQIYFTWVLLFLKKSGLLAVMKSSSHTVIRTVRVKAERLLSSVYCLLLFNKMLIAHKQANNANNLYVNLSRICLQNQFQPIRWQAEFPMMIQALVKLQKLVNMHMQILTSLINGLYRQLPLDRRELLITRLFLIWDIQAIQETLIPRSNRKVSSYIVPLATLLYALDCVWN